jgi:subtilase family serine protease
MRTARFTRSVLLGGIALALLLTTGPIAAQAAANPPAGKSSHVHVCGTPAHGAAACNAIRNDVASSGKVAPNVTPSGYGPSDLRSAYNLTTTGSSTQTVAIVDAYDDPNAEKDLATYRSTFGLPACSSASGCFTKVSQTGSKTSLPRANGGWAQEISLDLDMVSAICPGCHILLVEASSSSLTNLGTAVNEAARLGATAISNSYGGSESSSDIGYDSKYYSHPGIAITASSGDNGYGVEYPAASANVTAVGGTSLTRGSTTTTRGWSEAAWSGAGSGCSAYDPQTSGQNAADTGCTKRAVADVSAVADPQTGVAVYDSYAYQGASGWLVFGGTSVASPVIASVYALAGNAASIDTSHTYTNTSGLFDVTSGSNGTCTPARLCTAGSGWDGPTGLGTPNGTSAF